MKKIFASICVLAAFATSSFAQQEELKAAASNIEKQDYIAALEDISKAKKKVSKLMTDQIAAVLPTEFGEFKMDKSNEMGMGESQGVSVDKIYKKPQPKQENPEGGEANEMMDMPMDMGNQAQIMVQITTSMMMASEVMNAHSMSEDGMNMGGMDGMKSEPFRVKGYRALSKSYGGESEGEDMGMGQQKTEEVQAIVGGAFIRVTAQGLEKDGQAKAFLELVDFEKLISLVGK